MITAEQVIEVFKNYLDPELGIDIWTLGLVYEHKIIDDKVYVKMTLTSPFCPLGPQMVADLKGLLQEKGAAQADIEIVFEPPWQPSDELRSMLGV